MSVTSELVDEVPYADPSDVAVYIRNKTFDASSDPTDEQVRELLLRASSRIDRITGRAWRTRRVSDIEVTAQRSHSQRRTPVRGGRSMHGRARGRGYGVAGGRIGRRGGGRRRVLAVLNHLDVRSIDGSAGDSVVVLHENGETDITANEGRALGDGNDFVLDARSGLLHVDLAAFSGEGTTTSSGAIGLHGRSQPTLAPLLVRLSYRYGTDESAQTAANAETEYAQPSASVPGELRNACAKFVAADLIHTDQYGSMLASGPENTPDQTTAAGKLFAAARDATQAYRRRPSL